MLSFNVLYMALLLATAVVFADGPYLTTEQEYTTASNLTIHQQLVLLDQIRLEDQPRFKAELAKIRQLPLTQLADIEYLTLLNAYEQALQGQYDKVLAILTPLLKTSTDNQIITRSRIMAVNVLLLSNNHALAFTYFEQLLNTIPTITEPELLAQVILLVMFTYNQLERFDLTLIYERYITYSSVSDKLACRIRVIALEAKYLQPEVTVTDAAVNEVINHCIAAKETIPANLARFEQMRDLLNKNEVSSILKIYRQHIGEIELTNYPIMISRVKTLAASAHFKNGDYQQALQLALNALKLAQSSPNNVALVEAYDVLYQIAKAEQNYQQALAYLERKQQIENEFNASKTSQQIAYHTVKSEIELKNQRINLLDRDNELLFLQQSIYQEEAKNSRLWLMLVALLGFITLILAYRGLTGRKRFKLMAEYDQLTGISNRYHFNNQAKQALKYCQAKQIPVAMILFDLDHFKRINDQFGHATGDWALEQVVQACKQFMRSNDIFGRIGGEEFVIMMPGCELDKATLLAEICRDAIVSIDCNSIEHQFRLSASFGVSGSATSGYEVKQLLANADNAMYQAKAKGRNQVVEYQQTERE
ncbi:GGDEF domain-containing protein [Arsukibacterium indicum]|uniref:GGDEF domain-containing protein n=1 Tax=Arsukibacterium indicum TaxID=2848612 RepID=UPI0027E06399|nr:GGDEF domain-containing protein [Arsukibacterium indicum]